MNTADKALDDGVAMGLILGLIPESERARVAAIAGGDQALVCIGLGQRLGYRLGPCHDYDVRMRDAARHGADEEVDMIVRAYRKWLRDQVPTVH